MHEVVDRGAGYRFISLPPRAVPRGVDERHVRHRARHRHRGDRGDPRLGGAPLLVVHRRARAFAAPAAPWTQPSRLTRGLLARARGVWTGLWMSVENPAVAGENAALPVGK